MFSVHAKLQVFESYLKGKMPANLIVLGASHPRLPSNGTGRQWIPKRDFLAGFLGISSDIVDAVDVRCVFHAMVGRVATMISKTINFN